MPRWWRCPVVASDDLRPRVVEHESPDNPRVQLLVCLNAKRSCQNSVSLPQCALGERGASSDALPQPSATCS